MRARILRDCTPPLLVVLLVASLGADPKPQDEERATPTKQADAPPQFPTPTEGPASTAGQDQRGAEEPNAPGWHRLDWGGVPEWIALLITVGAVIAAFRTLGIMQAQTRIAEDSINLARLGAVDSARATKIAGETAAAQLEHVRTDMRAWVGIVKIESSLRVGRAAECRVFLANTGRTPAKRVKAWGRIEGRRNDGAPLQFKGPESNIRESITVMHPYHEGYYPPRLTFASSDAVKRDFAQDFAAESVLLHVYGRIEYEDVFGKAHWTTFSCEISKHGTFATAEHNDCD